MDSSEADPARLRVMTFNIQSAVRGMVGIAEVVRDTHPDVVALQEVDNKTSRSQGWDQTEQLAKMVGYSYYKHFSATPMKGGTYGLGVVSRLPILETSQIPLGGSAGLEPRIAVRVSVLFNDRPVSVYVTHLSNMPSRSVLRASQVRRILRWMGRDPNPSLVMGDLNDGASSKAVRLFERSYLNVFKRCGQGSAKTYPMPFFLPDQQLDYVFVSRDFRTLGSYVRHTRASDHHALVADLLLPPSLASSAGAKRISSEPSGAAMGMQAKAP